MIAADAIYTRVSTDAGRYYISAPLVQVSQQQIEAAEVQITGFLAGVIRKKLVLGFDVLLRRSD